MMRRKARLMCAGMRGVRMGCACLPVAGLTGKVDERDVTGGLKRHVIGWFSPCLEGVTNESLTANPVLRDLSGHGHELRLHNFVFGGLSGIGSYNVSEFRKTADAGIIAEINDRRVKVENTMSSNNTYTGNVTPYSHYKVKVYSLTRELKVMTKMNAEDSSYVTACIITEPGVYEVPRISGVNHSFRIDKGNSFEIEFLPDYEDSLVFNGTAKSYPCTLAKGDIEAENITISNNGHTALIDKTNSTTGTYVCRLNITETSFKLRVKFLLPIIGRPNFTYYLRDAESGENINKIITYINEDGTYILTPTEGLEKGGYYFAMAKGNKAEIEVLPTYPLPASPAMYGMIEGLPEHSIRCMMMDVTPFGWETQNRMYDQRKTDFEVGNKNYSIAKYSADNTSNTTLAYSILNKNKTYIDGQLNTHLTTLDLLCIPQVIAVNCEDPENSSTVSVGPLLNSSRPDIAPQMALRSLILFDKELTEEEMRTVMEKMMGTGGLLQ